MGESLIQVSRKKSNQQGMEQGVGIKAPCGAQEIMVTDRFDVRGRGRRAGASHRLETGTPESLHGPPLLGSRIVRILQRSPGGTGGRRKIGSESREGRGFLENPRKFPARGCGDAVEHDRAPEIPARSDAVDRRRSAVFQFVCQHRIHVGRENPSCGELVAIPRLGEERFRAKRHGRAFDCGFERQILECVQRVVVDEDADRPLRREQVCRMF
jgi:hypothetical protein